VKASEEQIARSLEGNWQQDLLFVLKQEQDGLFRMAGVDLTGSTASMS
jgi:hypothetical protein